MISASLNTAGLNYEHIERRIKEKFLTLYRYLQYVSQLQPHKKEKKNHALVNQNYEIKNSKRDQKVIIIRLKMLKF